MKCGIKEKDIKDFKKYAEKLDKIMERILSYNPDASIYLNMDFLELFGNEVFDIHEDYQDKNKVCEVWIRHSSGGEK